MDPAIIGLLGIIVMVLFMLIGMPISFAMMLVGFVGILTTLGPGAGFHLLAANLWGNFANYGLSVIPLFVLMGEFAYRSGVTERMYKSAYTWCGRLPGGLAATTILSCAGFGAICGSNSATAATMSTIAMPEMKKRKYSPALYTGSVAVGGTLGVVIPPSVVLIVIAIQTRQSVVDLFAAALFPGILLVSLMLATVFLLCWWKPSYGPPGERTSWVTKIKSLTGFFEVAVIFILVIGGLFAGLFTPTEAGAVGTVIALVLGLAQGHLGAREIIKALDETIRISAMVMLLVVAAILFGRFLAITRLPFTLADMISSMSISTVWILVGILVIYTLGGMFMDALGFLVVSIPVFFPLAMGLGFDPVWFSILLMLITTVGAVSPPVGVCAYIVSSFERDVEIQTVFRGVFFFIPAYVLCIAVLIAFPDIISTSLSLFSH